MFILTNDGSYVSADAVLEASQRSSRGEVRLKLTSGQEYSTSFRNWSEGTACWQLVPAEPGTYLLYYRRDSETVIIGREKVVAWALHRNGLLEPVTADGIYSAADFVPTVLHPDGTVQDVESLWQSYDLWLADVRENSASSAGPAD